MSDKGKRSIILDNRIASQPSRNQAVNLTSLDSNSWGDDNDDEIIDEPNEDNDAVDTLLINAAKSKVQKSKIDIFNEQTKHTQRWPGRPS